MPITVKGDDVVREYLFSGDLGLNYSSNRCQPLLSFRFLVSPNTKDRKGNGVNTNYKKPHHKSVARVFIFSLLRKLLKSNVSHEHEDNHYDDEDSHITYSVRSIASNAW